LVLAVSEQAELTSLRELPRSAKDSGGTASGGQRRFPMCVPIQAFWLDFKETQT
jgi:hypothetical protein